LSRLFLLADRARNWSHLNTLQQQHHFWVDICLSCETKIYQTRKTKNSNNLLRSYNGQINTNYFLQLNVSLVFSITLIMNN